MVKFRRKKNIVVLVKKKQQKKLKLPMYISYVCYLS